MSSKSLSTIQTLAKLGKVLSQIVFVCCLIGAIGCCVGIAVLLIPNGIAVGGTDITWMFLSERELAVETMVFACVSGLIACGAECVLSKFANVYFRHELAAGTPFTMAGSKEILRLGILTIAIPMGALILEGIAYGIYKGIFPAAERINMEDMTSVGMGILFIVASVVFQYGAELREQKNAEET